MLTPDSVIAELKEYEIVTGYSACHSDTKPTCIQAHTKAKARDGSPITVYAMPVKGGYIVDDHRNLIGDIPMMLCVDEPNAETLAYAMVCYAQNRESILDNLTIDDFPNGIAGQC